MGWSLGYNSTLRRWIGYGVPAYCDHPECDEEIDRGLSYVCGGEVEPYGGDHGCGMHFCDKHRRCAGNKRGNIPLCPRCYQRKPHFPVKHDHPEWVEHVLTDESWEEWRWKHRLWVERVEAALNLVGPSEWTVPE